MSLVETTHWYVRKHGWTQGPFTRDQVRHMYATSLISREDRVAGSKSGPWLPLHTVTELGDEPQLAPPPSDAVWEIASSRFQGSQPVSYGMLQMIAAAGKLVPSDLIRRTGDAQWRQARDFPGIFGGPRAWCTACGAEIDPESQSCPQCGAHQPNFEPSMASFALTCGVLAWVWSIVATISVVVLALRRTTILGIAVDQKFPQVFAVALPPAVMFMALAVMLSRMARSDIRQGRSSPAHLLHAIYAEWLGWAAGLLLALIVVAITAFSIAHFQRGS